MNNRYRLTDRTVIDDPAMEKVIAAQARVKELSRMVKTLKRDREQLLDEYTDAIKARSVPRAPKTNSKVGKIDYLRVTFGDVHGLHMDRSAVNAVLKDIKAMLPDEIVLLGDLMDCGGWLAKHQPIGFIANCDYSYQEDIKATNWLLDEIQKIVPNAVIHYIEGNHEDRVERWVVDQVASHKREAEFLLSLCGPQKLLRIRERGIIWHSRSEIHIPGFPRGWIKLGKMFFTHSLTYSKNAARQAAEKTAGNVTYGCTHREDTATVVFPAIGIVKAFNPGCLCQRQPIYMHSNPDTWSHGYSIDFVAKSQNFQRIQVPIWQGCSLSGAMITRFKKS